MEKIKIYTSQRMTGRMCDELVNEANMLVRTCENYGFKALNPVKEENVVSSHVILNAAPERLQEYWARDKQMIKEADILLDYATQNKSDGSNKEMGYARYCLWKPVIRVWDGPGAMISRIEDDVVVPTLGEAMQVITERWGTYTKLGAWRKALWERCYIPWLDEQLKMNRRYQCGVQLQII